MFHRGNSSEIQVMVGNTALTREPPSQIADVKTIFVHEDYSPDGRRNDVAILEVS
jgi:secreted trypsin-like serine protease